MNLSPALTIEREQIDVLCDALESAFARIGRRADDMTLLPSNSNFDLTGDVPNAVACVEARRTL